MTRLILEHDFGVVVDPGDPPHLASAVKALVADGGRLNGMKRNARAAAQKVSNWESDKQKLPAVHDRLTVVSWISDQQSLARDRLGDRTAESNGSSDGGRRG